ncbi:MAG: FAD-dependent oxidoreductase [Caulobacterales bacterium]
MSFNGTLGMPRSYYAATANAFTPTPRLTGAAQCDVCVVGGGFTGLSAALFLVERGFSVVLLEGGKIGWGASGRNGGQMIPGLRKGADELVKMYGRERAKAVFGVAIEARDLVVDLIEKYQIACDLKTTGHVLAASKESDLVWMAQEVSALREIMDYPHCRMLSQQEVKAISPMATAFGGLLDVEGGHLHPLNYALGLAEIARRKGARLFEQSVVQAIETQNGFVARTDAGEVSARYGFLAGDAFLGMVEPRIAGHIMPAASYIGVTPPLENPEAIIANDVAIADSKFVLNYFRLTADGRLLFGGGERYTPNPPADMAAFTKAQILKTFPQLAAVPVEYAWGGLASITMSRLPHCGRLGSAYFAHGFSGQGVIMTTLAGKLMADSIAGDSKGWDIFESFKPAPFPGGPMLRGPLYVAGMLYYALRDRL